ncbi:hypothetical protein Drose_01335 [Dactylosporangium roseum]|uniref:Lipoprotein n=1 Tax=Dactylosporangium roseum TaxID=47989 RepID=A0ABY5Z4R4_9ACTN|nr:hypothetical protein [Dactylosporangium roseum]UWZ37001.1 hypothetical protein Drose_01335 [Dactylosporangium roseum]
MTRSFRRRTVLGAALLASAALSVGLLSGCGAGQITGTDTQVPAIPGVNADSADGHLALRDAAVVFADGYKAGSTVPLSVRLFNNSKQAVKLTGVTTPAGTVVLVGKSSAGAAPTAAPSSAGAAPTAAPSSADASPSGSRRPSGSASVPGSASPSKSAAAPSPASPGTSQISIDIPVAGMVALTHDAGTYLAVSPLTGEPLKPGQNLPDITFTFTYADGTTTTLKLAELPMTTPLSPLPKPSAVVGGGEEGHH